MANNEPAHHPGRFMRRAEIIVSAADRKLNIEALARCQNIGIPRHGSFRDSKRMIGVFRMVRGNSARTPSARSDRDRGVCRLGRTRRALPADRCACGFRPGRPQRDATKQKSGSERGGCLKRLPPQITLTSRPLILQLWGYATSPHGNAAPRPPGDRHCSKGRHGPEAFRLLTVCLSSIVFIGIM
jgi:hypothetical protein